MRTVALLACLLCLANFSLEARAEDVYIESTMACTTADDIKGLNEFILAAPEETTVEDALLEFNVAGRNCIMIIGFISDPVLVQVYKDSTGEFTRVKSFIWEGETYFMLFIDETVGQWPVVNV